MKRFCITIAMVVVCYALFAQKGQVNKAANYLESGDLHSALECIQIATDSTSEKSSKSINWPRTWQVRGEIFQAYFQANDKKLKSITDDPLTEAFFS